MSLNQKTCNKCKIPKDLTELLGMAKDDIVILERAIGYLHAHA